MATKGDLDVALRIQADVAGALQQLRALAGQLDKLGAAATSASGKGDLGPLAQGAREAANAADQAQQRLAQVAQRARAAAGAGAQGDSPLIAQLREQIALQGKSTEEVLRYRAAQAGVGAQAAPLILQLQNIRAAQQAAAQAALEEANAQRQAAQAKQQQAASQDAFLAGLREQVALQGKSATDVLRYRAAQLGVGAQAEEHIQKLEELGRAGQRGANGLRLVGISAGQAQMAMRQLPMQVTDIATSLASGMPVWMVAVQQGGQLKDSFGGVGNVARALVSLVSPLTAALAAAGVVGGGLVLVMHQLQAEQAAYSAALVTTNNAAGTSIGQMRDYARQVTQVAGTTGAAADAIAQLAATGRVANADLAGAGTIAVQAQRLLGREVSQTAQIYAQLGKDPVQALLRLNEGTNFLTAAVLRQVMALKSQGRDAEAAALAQKAWGEQQTKVLADAEKNLGTLQRAWRAVADAAKGAWDAMLDIGRPKGAQEQIEAQERAVAALRERVASRTATAATRQRLAAAERRLAELREQAEAEKQGAAAEAATVADNQNQLDELDPARVAARSGVARAEAARALAARVAGLEKLREATLDAFLVGEQDAATHQAKLLELDRARIRAQITEVGRLRQIEAARPTKDENDALAKQAALTQLDTQRVGLEQQLEKQRIDQKAELARVLESAAEQTQESSRRVAAAMAGEAASTDKATESMQRWIQRNRQALGISDQLAVRLLELARTQDSNGALERAARALPEIQAQWLEATGKAAASAALQIEQRFKQLRADLVTSGQLDAVAKVDVIINVQKAKAELARLRDQVEQIFADEQLSQQRINAGVAASRVTPGQAQEQRVQLARTTANRLEGQLPAIQAQVDALPDGADKSRLLNQLEQYKQRIVELRDETGLLQQAFTQTFAGGLATAIEGLATGTLSLRDAARGLLLDMARGMAQVAAQELASLATKRLLILVTGQQAAASAAASGVQATAAVAASTTQTAAAVGAMTTVAAAQTAAATQVAAASAPAAAATATWSWGAAALAGLAALAAVYALAQGFETGGRISGPGTGTSDSIPIWASNGEFMVRERSVRQPGAQAFLEDFNRMGMRAVETWRGYAGGGLIGEPMAMPAPAGVPASFNPASPAEAQGGIRSARIVNVLDKSVFDDWATTPSFERLIVNVIGRNPAAVRNVVLG